MLLNTHTHKTQHTYCKTQHGLTHTTQAQQHTYIQYTTHDTHSTHELALKRPPLPRGLLMSRLCNTLSIYTKFLGKHLAKLKHQNNASLALETMRIL